MDDATKTWSGLDVVTNQFGFAQQKLYVVGSKLCAVSMKFTGSVPPSLPAIWFEPTYATRDLTGSTWTSPITIDSNSTNLTNFFVFQTQNGNVNLITLASSTYKQSIISTSGVSIVEPSIGFSNSIKNGAFAVQGNEVYLFSKFHTTSGLSFREYNYSPSQVVNLSSSSGANNHPVISWSASPEPDVVTYNIYKDGQYIGYTTTNNYTDLAEVIVTGPATDNETIKKYKVKAVDIGSMFSPFSAELNVRIWQESLEKRGENGEENNATTPSIYSLGDNYPNPFNPTTRFNFSIAQEENVRITVYSMLGEPVGELVNERLAAGEYSLSFDASSLASGTYIYVIKAGSFTQSKKMVLMK